MSNQAVQRNTTKGNGVGGWSGEDGKKKERRGGDGEGEQQIATE